MSTNKLLCFTGGSCGVVPGIDHGFVENTTSVLTTGSATYKCFEGFTLRGNAEVKCTDDRTWDSRPTCPGEYNVIMYKAKGVYLSYV